MNQPLCLLHVGDSDIYDIFSISSASCEVKCETQLLAGPLNTDCGGIRVFVLSAAAQSDPDMFPVHWTPPPNTQETFPSCISAGGREGGGGGRKKSGCNITTSLLKRLQQHIHPSFIHPSIHAFTSPTASEKRGKRGEGGMRLILRGRTRGEEEEGGGEKRRGAYDSSWERREEGGGGGE